MQTAVKIPDFVFQASHLTPDEVFLELAVSLFEKKKLTLGQASDLCNLSQYQFQHILASININVHYNVEDLEDVRKIKRLQVWCSDVNAAQNEQKYFPLYVKQELWDKHKRVVQ